MDRPPGDLEHVGPGGDPERDGGVPKIVRTEWSEARVVDGGLPDPPMPRGRSKGGPSSWSREDEIPSSVSSEST